MNTHRRLRIATIFVLFTAYILAGFQAAFSAHRQAVARHAAAIKPITAADPFHGYALAQGRTPYPAWTLKPHPVVGHAVPPVQALQDPVQTSDLLAPPQSFTPINSQPRVATNLQPVWTPDEQYILFSSNRDADGKILNNGHRYHIWAAPVNGSVAPVQITTSPALSTDDTDGKLHGEFYPALNSTASSIAFTSDANSTGNQNLYAIDAFAVSAFFASTAATPIDVTSLLGTADSKTIRPDSAAVPFNNVARPTWGGDGQIAFSATDTSGSNAGVRHIWFLYSNTLGYRNDANASNNLPGKITDGPATDNNPAWSADGSFIAFDSTASTIQQVGTNSTPTTPTVLTQLNTTTNPNADHSIFLLTGSGVIPSALLGNDGVTGRPLTNGSTAGPNDTAAEVDDVTPAWSNNGTNPYTNPTGNLQYLAFARATASGSAPANTLKHDIYYLSVANTGTPVGGESGPSQIAAAEEVPTGTAITQVNAGGPDVAPYTGDANLGTLTPPVVVAGGAPTAPATPPAVNVAVANAAPQAVYQSWRHTTGTSTSFSYTISNLGANIAYTLRLHFADLESTGAGQRVFNVYQQDTSSATTTTPLLTNFDVYNDVGADTADVQSFVVTSDANGEVQIVFANGTAGSAMVSGLQLLSLGAITPINNPGTASTGAPQTVTATPGIGAAGPQITLTWTAAPAVAYRIYRAVGPFLDGAGNQRAANIGDFSLYALVPTAPRRFVDTNVQTSIPYYYYVTAVSATASVTSVTPESSVNGAIRVNTETNANSYDDLYPAWSAFNSTFDMAYQSPRSITYTDPSTGIPSQTEISLPDGSTTPAIGSAYTGILISRVLDLDPPSLVPFNANEVIHINSGTTPTLPSAAVGGDPTGGAIRILPQGGAVTFTVRLSNREAGIDNTGGASGGPRVYIQIKDPDSKYQDDQHIEHKVFAEDPALNALNTTSGSASTWLWPTRGFTDLRGFDVINNATYYQSGVVGGSDGTNTISVGIDNGGTNPASTTQNPVPGGNPQFFTCWGPEYECQFVNPLNSTPLNGVGDYGTPFYLAGFDDRTPLSGNAHAPRPSTNSATATAEWLQLQVSPTQDNLGGVLYSGTWTVPSNTKSDYIFDVIAYDKAVFPVRQVLTGSQYGGGENWRIYDNVWGASSISSIDTSPHILVVSDYMLGQKFQATSYSGALLQNLRPIYYGAESYVTDVDVSYLPTAGYYYIAANGGVVTYIDPINSISGAYMTRQVRNALGALSYRDSVVADGGSSPADGSELYKSNTYAIWRTLCRGPVTSQVLANYLPETPQAQPAVDNGAFTGTKAVPAASVPVADRCVLWFSPYESGLLTGSGTLSDSTTQANLTSFINAGGRLCVSGPEVASTVPPDPNTPSFVRDYLHVTLTSPSATTRSLATGANHAVANTLSNQFWTSNDIDTSNTMRYDASLDEFGPNPWGYGPTPSGTQQSALGTPDVLAPYGTAQSDWAWADGSGSGIVYWEQTAANQTSTSSPIPAGTRTVTAGFGLETISNDYHKEVYGTGPFAFDTPTSNNRAFVMHGIVNYLRTGSFTGLVQDTSSLKPLQGAIVYAVPAGGQLGTRAVYSATTDSTGTYNILGVPSGVYNVFAYAVGYSDAPQHSAVTVEGDVIVPQNFQMSALPKATITGTVSDGSGNPVSGAAVTFKSADGTVQVQGTTNALGKYSIANVPAAAAGTSYTGTASKAGYQDATLADPLTVLPGQEYDNVNFTLSQAPATVKGIVFDTATNAPISGATVQAVTTASGAIAQTVTTGTDGSYTLTLQPGAYKITATMTNYNANSITVTVSAGQSLTGQNIGLTFTPGGYLGGYVVTSTGGPDAFTISVTGTATASTNTVAVTSPTAPKGDGKPQNWNLSLTPGTYTVTITSSLYGTQTVSNVTVSSNAFTRVPDVTFTTGELIGLVKTSPNTGALNGGTVTIEDTTGKVLKTLTTTSSAVTLEPPTGDGALANYSVALPAGKYTVVFSRTGFADSSATATITANKVTRVDYAFPAIHTFSAGLQFFSLPYDYSSTTWNGLFGALGSSRSHVAVWQQALGQYVLDPTSPADAPRLGYGYWIRLAQPIDITQAGASPTTGTISVPLTAGWNMIGVPSTSSINVTSLEFVNPLDTGHPLTWAQATGIQYNLVSSSLYYYDPTAGQYVAVDSSGQLTEFTGYWIKANDNATLLIPTTGP